MTDRLSKASRVTFKKRRFPGGASKIFSSINFFFLYSSRTIFCKPEKPMAQKKSGGAICQEEAPTVLSQDDVSVQDVKGECHMIDDHGPVIFGNRLKRPIFLDDEDE